MSEEVSMFPINGTVIWLKGLIMSIADQSSYKSIVSSGYVFILIFVALLLPFLYEFSNTFRMLLKYLLYYIFVMMSSTVCLPFIIWTPGDVRNTLVATKPLHWLNSLLGLEWEIRGIEHIRPERAAVVVANHQSSIDFLGMVHVWPYFDKISPVAKKELFYFMPFGITAWLCGVRFIDRSKPQRARDSMTDALNYCIDNKVKLWIFPEGTRNMKEEMLPFKKGAFHIAIQGQIPILPVVYSSYSDFLNTDQRIFNPGQARIECLAPIETKGMTVEDMPKLMEDTRNAMMSAYTKNSAEVKQPYPVMAHLANKDS